MKRQPKMTRREKTAGEPKSTKTKPQWGESYGINKVILTPSQNELRNKILSNDLVFCEGPAGTGKTLAVLFTYVKEYLNDASKQIIVIRTPVEAGMDKIGALPDDKKAKLAPHFASVKKLLDQLLTKGKVETDMDHRIHFEVPNYCLGATFDNSLILIDEVQQLPPLILKLLLERTGVNSKVVCLGDNTQLYVNAHNRNALLDAIPRFFYNESGEILPKYDNVEYHKFEIQDIQRSDLVKTVVAAYS